MPQRRTPSYGLHKATGQAVVRIDGHDNYLGKHGSPESLEAYQTLINKLRAGQAKERPRPAVLITSDVTVVEILLKFVQHATGRVSPGELENICLALRPLRLRFGSLLAHTIGAEQLLTLQQDMAKQDLARATINSRIGKIRRCFKWAAAMRLVPASVYHDMAVVDGLREGDLGTQETEPVQPVEALASLETAASPRIVGAEGLPAAQASVREAWAAVVQASIASVQAATALAVAVRKFEAACIELAQAERKEG